jgi:hypothetical protein
VPDWGGKCERRYQAVVASKDPTAEVVPTSLLKFWASVCRKDSSVAFVPEGDVDASVLLLELPVLLVVDEPEPPVALPELPAAESRFWKSLCSAASGPPPGGGGGTGAARCRVAGRTAAGRDAELRQGLCQGFQQCVGTGIGGSGTADAGSGAGGAGIAALRGQQRLDTGHCIAR